MPRTIKQYCRAILVKLGLFDEAAFRLVIDRVFPDDTFIVSYPKSGNTWMRFLVANLLHPGQEITFRNIDQFVPDVYSAREQVNKLKQPRFIKTHDAWFRYYPKTIYIVRDYRDVLVSYYHYQKALGVFTGSLSAYLSAINTLHSFGSWSKHVQEALQHQKKNPGKIIIIRYEDLLADTVSELKKITSWSGIGKNADMETVAARCRFEELLQVEKNAGSTFMDKTQGANFFREGQAGSWQQVLSETDLQTIYTQPGIRETLTELGYNV